MDPKISAMGGPSDIQIFDRRLLRQRRQRAAGRFGGFNFLKAEVAARLCERLEDIKRPFPRVLDLGAHTGDLGRCLAARETLECLASTDLAENLVRHAPQDIPGVDTCRITADEEFLPFAEESFDLVISAISLQWVNDLPGSLIQVNRILKPDGLFLAAMLGGDSLNELRACLLAAEAELYGGASPRVSPFADIRDAGGLLQRAGFALPVTDSEVVRVDYENAFGLMRDLQGMGASNAVRERSRRPVSRRFLTRVAEIYQERYARADGRVEATFEILYLTGWAPHDSQQKPLPPGSAKVRLAEALGTKEKSAGEKAGG